MNIFTKKNILDDDDDFMISFLGYVVPRPPL